MYLEHITINNFRALTDFSLDLKPGMNLIIGDNGSGKTSVMEALATGLAGVVYHIESQNAHNIAEHDIRKSYEQDGSVLYQAHYYTPVTVETTAVIDGETHTWTRSRNSELPRTATGMSGASIRDWSRRANAGQTLLPLISYRKATSLGVPEKESRIRLANRPLERKTGYRNALKGQIFDDIYAWLTMLVIKKNLEQEPREYRLFKEFIGRVMQRISELPETPVVEFDAVQMKILYGEDGHLTDIETLSAGYYWILWMFMDLAARSLILNPQLERVEEIQGVVLIDEIDLHLHPKWQWNILPTLQEVLPRVQFIVTTHAPILLSSVKDANIIRIGDQKEVDYLGDAYAYSIRDVVELTQGSSGSLPELKNTYYAFEEAYCQKDYARARSQEAILRENFPNSTETQKAKLKVQMLNMKGV